MGSATRSIRTRPTCTNLSPRFRCPPVRRARAWPSKTRADCESEIGCCLAGVQRVDGYAGLEPARALDYATLPALRLAGTQYVLRHTPNGSEPNWQWTAISPTAPRARMIPISKLEVDRSQGDAASSPAAFFSRFALHGKQAVAHEFTLKPQIIEDRPGHIVVACQRSRAAVARYDRELSSRLARGRGWAGSSGGAGRLGFSGLCGRRRIARSRVSVSPGQPAGRGIPVRRWPSLDGGPVRAARGRRARKVG